MQNFKDLLVWQKAHILVLMVYEASKAFPREEIYSLTTQIRRCSTSIAANLVQETEYYFLLAKDLKYISNLEYIKLDTRVSEIKAMLISLIKKVRTSNLPALKPLPNSKHNIP